MLERQHVPCNGPTSSTREQSSRTNDASLSELIDRFLEAKSHAVNPKTLGSYRAKCEVFSRILTEANAGVVPSVVRIDATLVRNYADTIAKLPKNLVASEAKSIQRLTEAGEQPIDPATKNFHLRVIKDLLTWADKQYSLFGYDAEHEEKLELATSYPVLLLTAKIPNIPLCLVSLFAMQRSKIC